MRLLEFQAKHLFKRYGIPVPAGQLWDGQASGVQYPVALKSQLHEGGRGKRGGVLFAIDAAQAARAAEALMQGNELLPSSTQVLVEAKLDISHEAYLAIAMDRRLRRPVVLAHPEGGVDIEDRNSELLYEFALHPLVGPPRFLPQQVADALGPGFADAGAQVASVVSNAIALFMNEDAELLEINPLVRTTGGMIVAADAKIELDDAAQSRHTDWPRSTEGTPFENACTDLGASGTEMAGDVAIVTSGAGLAMATLDSVASAGGTVRCVVDLAGTVFAGPEAMGRVFECVVGLSPKVLLVNCFFQLARCEQLAAAMRAGLVGHRDTPVVARLKGNGQRDAWAILAELGVALTGDMRDAARNAVREANRASLG